ncbi:hypothetical protein BOTBODRAFT_171644 [Botryobasidium botryosum FD-172 SS1]|uniref:Uncharacterized protein n=1 Tax=Botryobasidium botryosum (strain FD-172 SS1) TaxID=930990 RepID=A0A067MTB2_BOTB1|nr:hypothetical protein BOTBODRAFT_171644 [Botryobasidium botryosum FD-172 SS1]
MQSGSKDSHLGGRAHREKLGYGSEGARRKKTSPPYYSDSYDDLSEDEAAGILYDIDTQWGAMPQGGAYKDSNHYYGPGIYDYY